MIKHMLVLLMGWCLMGQFSLKAQDLRGALTLQEEGNVWTQLISVEEALRQLEKNYDLTFIFENHLVEGKYFPANEEQAEDFHTALQQILTPLNLKYERAGDQSFILLPKEEPLAKITFQAQEMIVGQVTDASTGETLPGVNVVVKGTATGTSTNNNGRYELEVPSLQDTLVFSFVGFQTQEVPINGQTEIDVLMQPQTVTGEELVVVGYGTVSRENLTSSVSKVTSDDFIQGSSTDPAQLIRGKVAGLSVNKVGADPTENSTLMLRGTGTLIGDASPLVIIDGVEGTLSDVSTQDIESINVIKDASAAAIYGTRGSNGVVVIETNRAERDAASLKVDSYISTQQVTDRIPVLTAEEYRNVSLEGLEPVDFGASNDWQELVFRDMPISQEHNLSFSSGTDQTSYIATLNYKNFEGLVNRSDNNVVNGRLRVDHSMLDDKLNLTGNIYLSKKWHFQGAEGGSFNGRVVNDVTAFNPTRPIFNPDGSYNDSGDNNHENPVSIVEESNGEFQETRANFFGTIEYSPIQNLSLKLQGSSYTTDVLEGFSRTKAHVIDIRDGTNGYASRTSDKTIESIIEATGEYKNSYKSHNYSILGGYTWKETNREGFFSNNWDFPTDAVRYNNLSDGLALSRGETSTDSFKEQSNLLGYFSRINYNYNNKYLFMASFRREASSKFGVANKWGTFPAFSVGWNITREPFMEPLEFIEQLKIRFGYGITGTAPTSPYLSLSRLSFGSRFLSNGNWVSTIQPLNNPNPNLKWETREELNLGLDFIVLNGRVDGSIDLYKRETRDLLFNFTVPTPPFLFNSILANAGTIENKGLEVSLNVIPVQRREVQWNSTINYSTNSNELTSLSNEEYSIGEGGFFDAGYTGAPIQQQTHRVQVGEAIGNFYGFKTIGITDDGMWLIEGANGQPKSIADQVPDDKHFIGNGVPNHELSWSNTLRYKNWDISVLMRGAFDFQIANMRSMFFGVPQLLRQANVLRSALDDKFGQRPLSVDQPEQYVSHFIEDGDFWKIDNITLGHSFNISRSEIVKNARVYLSGNNLITITGYTGYDPDVSFSGLAPAVDGIIRFPSTKTYTLGLSLTF